MGGGLMTQLSFTVVPADDSPDTLIALEVWLTDEGLGSRIERVSTAVPVPGVGHQGSVLDAVVAVLDTSGIAVLIRSVAALARSALGRGRDAQHGYSLECGEMKVKITTVRLTANELPGSI
jgi:hypothetical protein